MLYFYIRNDDNKLSVFSSLAQIPAILAKQVSFVESGKGWVLKIVPDIEDLQENSNNASHQPPLSVEECENGVGTVCLWESYWDGPNGGESITEVGWGVAPRFKGRGLGKKAVLLLLSKARKECDRWGDIHAFTATSNTASNAICKSCGFEFISEHDMDYDGRKFPGYHYRYYTKSM